MLLVDRANQLTLTVPEMTVLVGGMRALDANNKGSRAGVLTDRPGTLTNDFFVNHARHGHDRRRSSQDASLYEGLDHETGKPRWTATSVDLLFGSHSELRAIT